MTTNNTGAPAPSLNSLLMFLNPDMKRATITDSNTIEDLSEFIKSSNDGDMIIYADGVYVINKRRIGWFLTIKDKFKHPIPLYETGTQMFIRDEAMPKVPGYLFKGIIRFYQKIHAINKNEVAAQIWWDKVNNEYKVEVPEQQVSSVTIKYDTNTGYYVNPDMELIVTSHSHHTMGAFFSGTDDSDEKGKNGIYSFVFGNLVNSPNGDTFTYKTVQRVCFADALINLNIEDFIDFDAEGEFVIPDADYAKVKPLTYTSPYSTGASWYSRGNADTVKPNTNYYLPPALKDNQSKSKSKSSKVKKYNDSYNYDDEFFAQYGMSYDEYVDYFGWPPGAFGNNAPSALNDTGAYSLSIQNDIVGDFFSNEYLSHFSSSKSEYLDELFSGGWDEHFTNLTSYPDFTRIAAAFGDFKNTLEKCDFKNFLISAFMPMYIKGMLEYMRTINCPDDMDNDIVENTAAWICGMSIYALRYACNETKHQTSLFGYNEDVRIMLQDLLDEMSKVERGLK